MEIWKTIKGFEDYQVSNLGNVKSLKYGKERILKFTCCKGGYRYVVLSFNKKLITKKIHQLVAIAFLNHTPCGHKLVVNHKDFNRQNNKLDNLEIISQRENTSKKHIKSISKYTGVSWNKQKNKWISYIWIVNKLKRIGSFDNEYDAHLAYEKELLVLLK